MSPARRASSSGSRAVLCIRKWRPCPLGGVGAGAVPLAAQSGLLHLVEQRAVAHLEFLGGPHPIPAILAERPRNRLALRRQRRLASHLLERRLDRGRPRGCSGRYRRRHALQGGLPEERIVENDHALDDVLELAHVARVRILPEEVQRLLAETEARAVEKPGISLGE